MSTVTMKQLLEAGVHFGHQTRRWNPKMSPYIFGERNGIHIIDLRQTLEQLNRACGYIGELCADGGTVLFVGTKKQAQQVLENAAAEAGMPYVNHRWLGGMLTNFHTTHKRIMYMKELRRMEETGEMTALPKKERLRLRRELGKLEANLGGVADLHQVPDAVFIIDVKIEDIAVKEANRLQIPVVAVVDSNCDPDPIDIVIPGNDDAIRAAEVMAAAVATACREGRELYEAKAAEQAAAKARARELEEARRAEADKARQEAAARAEAEAAEQAEHEKAVAEPSPAPAEPAAEADASPAAATPVEGGSQ